MSHRPWTTSLRNVVALPASPPTPRQSPRQRTLGVHTPRAAAMFVELLLDHLGQKAGTRIDVSDADAKFLIDGGKAKAVAGDPLADVVGKSISDAMGKITGGLQAAVDAALKEFAAAQAKSRKSRVPEI